MHADTTNYSSSHGLTCFELAADFEGRAQVCQGHGEVVAHNGVVGRHRECILVCCHSLLQPVQLPVHHTTVAQRLPEHHQQQQQQAYSTTIAAAAHVTNQTVGLETHIIDITTSAELLLAELEPKHVN